MDRNEYRAKYEEWKKNAVELSAELAKMTDAEIEDAFYRDLEFGTGGLRGVIGAGTNRMNVYTVAKASQGLANYVNKTYPDVKKIAVAYDSRIKSDVFSRVASEVFGANGEKYSAQMRMDSSRLYMTAASWSAASGSLARRKGAFSSM